MGRSLVDVERKAYADLDELEMLDEKKYTLEKALGDSVREFIYEYDFGDRWRRRINVQATVRWRAAGRKACVTDPARCIVRR